MELFFHKKEGHEDMFGYYSEGTYSAEGTDPFEWKGTTQVGVSQIKKSSQIQGYFFLQQIPQHY